MNWIIPWNLFINSFFPVAVRKNRQSPPSRRASDASRWRKNAAKPRKNGGKPKRSGGNRRRARFGGSRPTRRRRREAGEARAAAPRLTVSAVKTRQGRTCKTKKNFSRIFNLHIWDPNHFFYPVRGGDDGVPKHLRGVLQSDSRFSQNKVSPKSNFRGCLWALDSTGLGSRRDPHIIFLPFYNF